MTNQSQPLCPICGNNPVSEGHHLLRRGSHPEEKDNPKNILKICADCHRRTETDQKFYEALQQIFFYWRPGNADLFMRAQATLESLLKGDMVEFITPGQTDNYLTLSQAGYSFYSDRLATLEQMEAMYFVENKNDEVTNTELNMNFRGTETGQEMIAVRRKVKSLEKMMSAMRTKLKRMSDERFNQTH